MRRAPKRGPPSFSPNALFFVEVEHVTRSDHRLGANDQGQGCAEFFVVLLAKAISGRRQRRLNQRPPSILTFWAGISIERTTGGVGQHEAELRFLVNIYRPAARDCLWSAAAWAFKHNFVYTYRT